MAKSLTVAGAVYQYPESRDPPGWGDQATAWAVAVTNVMSNVIGVGDILQSSAVIANNQASAANITGLQFDPTTVRAAIVEYTAYRVTTSTGATERVETGTMYIAYKSTAGAYEISIVGAGSAGLQFSMTSSGLVQYTSDNQSGSSYSGIMHFRARALSI